MGHPNARDRSWTPAVLKTNWLKGASPAFRLMIATSWLAPEAWRENQETTVREAIQAGPDWAEYLRLVDRHRTPALSWAALTQTPGVELPELIAQELRKRNDACRIEAVKQCLLLASLLKGFNRAGIPVMPLKGQLLSFALYGDVGLRQSRDLDLAVAEEDLLKAKDCLETMGWTLDPSIWFPLTPRQWASVLQHEHHLEFVHSRTGCPLELHWRDQWETPDATRSRWNRSVPSVWQGCSMRLMSREDMTLYLCSHGGHHMWFRVKWLGDLARAHAAGQLDWKTALGMDRGTGQQAVLNVGLCLLNRVYGLPLPDLPEDPLTALQSQLIEIPLAALADHEEPLNSDSAGWFLYRLRISRYEKLLRPRKARRESLSQLLYGREDFRTLRLPDSLFRVYALLHPILGAWRRVRRLYRPARPKL
jgi:hypothetical protein